MLTLRETTLFFVCLVAIPRSTSELHTCPSSKYYSKLTSMFFVSQTPGEMLNPFHAAGLFLYPLKTPENLWFCDVFRVYRKKPVAGKFVYNSRTNYDMTRYIEQRLIVTIKLWCNEKISMQLTLSGPNPGRREEIKLNFYFLTSLWCFKRFYEDPKGLHETFWGTTKKCENKNLT